MSVDDVRRVLVVGGGTMGQQIAAYCVLHDVEVVIYDIDPAALQRGAAVKAIAGDLFSSRDAERIEQIVAGLDVESDPNEAARDVDLLIETVPEKVKLKREVFAQFDVLCPPNAIFTTNTSTFLPSALADATGRPSQFAALHFGLRGAVAEIMPHPRTSPKTVRRLQTFARKIGHLPITCRKESPGHVINTLLFALNAAALRLAADGVASIEEIDRAWMKALDVPFGPFGLLDGVGLDTAWSITEFRAKLQKDVEIQKIADFLKQYVDQGRLGIKSGLGFYEYPNPAYRETRFFDDE
jgi:3-hydroxybutyryl-CoA dehydrogenase